ncbi:MAG: M23 family metallopeptidase [Alistipes sp.]|nr:M23 family metallopeptidase [Alistipes sp.]
MNIKRFISTKAKSKNSHWEPILLKALGWIAMVLFWYIVLGFTVYLPKEYKLRHSSDKMREEYVILHERYDSLTSVLDNVIARDENVFRKLFESNPYDLNAGSKSSRAELHEELVDMSNSDLDRRMSEMLAVASTNEDKMLKAFDRMREAIVANEDNIEYIPAIQPVNNRQLTLLASGKKPLINPFHRTLREHHGIDYLVPEGTAVFATADGSVKSLSEKNSSHGKAVIIDHGNGYQTSYSHLLDIRVKKGQKVKRGDIIALSGNSGLSFAPHLHYEVIYNDTRVDPIHYFFLELTPEEYQSIIRIALSSMQSFD